MIHLGFHINVDFLFCIEWIFKLKFESEDIKKNVLYYQPKTPFDTQKEFKAIMLTLLEILILLTYGY